MKSAKILLIILPLFIYSGLISFVNYESFAQVKTYQIGDRGPAGGWIFYDNGDSSNGWRYLEAAPVDQSAGTRWNTRNEYFEGLVEHSIGNGKNNTLYLIKHCKGSSIAARKAMNYRGGGKKDWYLPSRDELTLMYNNLHKAGIGAFKDKYYWSSSGSRGDDGYYMYAQNFKDGYRDVYGIDFKACVRAIRSF